MSDIPLVLPADESVFQLNRSSIKPKRDNPPPDPDDLVEVNERSTLGLVELILKRPARVDALARGEDHQGQLIPRFLAVALISYLLFALAMVLLLNAAPSGAWPTRWLEMPPAHWHDGTALGLVLAYTLGFTAATGVCLPSFYFYGLLAGVKMSMLQVTGQVMKGKAFSAIMLVGLLTIYVALMMGLIIFEVPNHLIEFWLYLGLALPFAAGLWGIGAIYRGVMGLADTLPPERRCRRTCFLRRLTLAWSACYAAVAPVMIYTLWDYFAR